MVIKSMHTTKHYPHRSAMATLAIPLSHTHTHTTHMHTQLTTYAHPFLRTLIFPIRPGDEGADLLAEAGSGPPYGMSFELVESLLTKAGLELIHRECPPRDLMHMPKMGAATVMACWRIRDGSQVQQD